MSKKFTVKERGIYILPSLFTTAGLFAGFYSLIAAIQGRYELAAWALIVAAIFDVLDGRVARMMQAETAFGAEYDSMCDMLSFGIAPAVLVYLWALVPLHKLGWLAAFLIAACAALRLARFNTQIGTTGKRYFQGLPTPAAALFICTAVLFHEDQGFTPIPWLWFFIAVVLAWLMISRVRFFAGKDIDLSQRKPFTLLVMMLAVLVFVMVNPHLNLFILAFAYCLYGPMLSLWQRHQSMRARLRRRQHRRKQIDHQEDQQEPTQHD